MMAGFPASYFCIKAFSETDQTEDLKKFDVPTLILHGDDDQIVPIQASAMLSSTLIKGERRLVPTDRAKCDGWRRTPAPAARGRGRRR